MGTSGDKIVLLDGMGSGSGSAANGLLSMIPGMFTSLLGGNKMDPNLVAALMNGRNNQDQFGGANGWWLWIIVITIPVTSGSLRNVKDIMSGRMRCTVRDGLASVTSVTSTMVRNLICVEVGEVVTTEEQTLMTRIISGI